MLLFSIIFVFIFVIFRTSLTTWTLWQQENWMMMTSCWMWTSQRMACMVRTPEYLQTYTHRHVVPNCSYLIQICKVILRPWKLLQLYWLELFLLFISRYFQQSFSDQNCKLNHCQGQNFLFLVVSLCGI